MSVVERQSAQEIANSGGLLSIGMEGVDALEFRFTSVIVAYHWDIGEVMYFAARNDEERELIMSDPLLQFATELWNVAHPLGGMLSEFGALEKVIARRRTIVGILHAKFTAIQASSFVDFQDAHELATDISEMWWMRYVGVDGSTRRDVLISDFRDWRHEFMRRHDDGEYTLA